MTPAQNPDHGNGNFHRKPPHPPKLTPSQQQQVNALLDKGAFAPPHPRPDDRGGPRSSPGPKPKPGKPILDGPDNPIFTLKSKNI